MTSNRNLPTLKCLSYMLLITWKNLNMYLIYKFVWEITVFTMLPRNAQFYDTIYYYVSLILGECKYCLTWMLWTKFLRNLNSIHIILRKDVIYESLPFSLLETSWPLFCCNWIYIYWYLCNLYPSPQRL